MSEELSLDKIGSVFALSIDETQAVAELAEKQDLSAQQVVRQAIRMYQAVALGEMTCERTDPPVGCPQVD